MPEQYDPAEYVEAVLATVERIPPGRVMSYGAIAEYLYPRFDRGSARRVGTIMAQYGGSVPWYRVVNGAGRFPPGHEVTARTRLVAEGVVLTGPRIRMAEYAWWPDEPTTLDEPARSERVGGHGPDGGGSDGRRPTTDGRQPSAPRAHGRKKQ